MIDDGMASVLIELISGAKPINIEMSNVIIMIGMQIRNLFRIFINSSIDVAVLKK